MVTQPVMPDLAVGLIRVRDGTQRSAEQGGGIPPYVVEVMVKISNRGESVANETTTRFWVRGPTWTRNCGSSLPPLCRRAMRSKSRQRGMSATVTAIT